MEQRTFIRDAQTFRDCSHAANGRRKGFKSRNAACPSLVGLGIGPIAVASTTPSTREFDASPLQGCRLTRHFFSLAADLTLPRRDA